MALINVNRRAFLGQIATVPAALPFRKSAGRSPDPGPLTPETRRNEAFQIRIGAARYHHDVPLIPLVSNGDDASPLGSAGAFGKTLDHNSLGETEPAAYRALLRALDSGWAADFDAIPRGAAGKLANPAASYAFCLEGPDPHQISVPAAPAFASARTAGEMVEVYWQALTRDVPFAEYDVSPAIQQAAGELSRLTDFHGPRIAGQVTPASVFRGGTPGDLAGPYLSQLLWKPVVYGLTTIDQKYRTSVAARDYMTSAADWLSIQRGNPPSEPLAVDMTLRYIRNGRDLAAYVYRDFSYQAILNAALILSGLGGAAISDENPYKTSVSQSGGITSGSFQLLDWLARVSTAAMKAAWCHKWLVHRRIRPEELGGRIHYHLNRLAAYPLHQDVLNSAALATVKDRYGTCFVPMAYPDGCPPHPSYPAGHAVIAGAGVTVLKSFFLTGAIIPDPVVASLDGLSLAPWVGPPLTIAGELNKLAANIAIGRDAAGVHYRSDGIEGLRLGEAVAIGILGDLVNTVAEDFDGLRIARFDGTEIVIRRQVGGN